MDPEEKRKLSNEKRLRALKQWKKNLTVQKIKQPRPQDQPIHKVVDPNTKEDSKLILFESDEEEENYEENFKSRPQFDGPHGQEILEMSSKFPERFKLDQRFKEDYQPGPVTEDNQEKGRNLKILQSILGYEVAPKHVDKNTKKQAIRFDPEDEEAVKCLKQSENFIQKPKKPKLKKRSKDDKIETEIPVSTERYIEVSSNLKDILNSSSTPFSFTQRFNEEVGVEFIPENKKAIPDYENEEEELEKKIGDLSNKDEDKKNVQSQEYGTTYLSPKRKSESFFMKSDDSRLKEGVEFFKRPKPLEEIREEWLKKKDYVLELFKKRKKANMRSRSTKVRSMQFKNALRKQNYQYL